MDDLLTEVHQRANLALSNHMEMLTFFLTDGQQYGINVFKIIEVIETPKQITQMPHAHPAIIGAIDFRGRVVSTIDLSAGLGLPAVEFRQELSYVIICEYSGTTQGLLIARPDKLVNKNWEEIKKPSGSMLDSGYLTAITYDELGHSIQILDVEKILGEVVGVDEIVDKSLLEQGKSVQKQGHRVLVLDDSKAARKLLEGTLTQMGVDFALFEEGSKALEALREARSAKDPGPFDLIISDIEMPGMDGFTFTRTVKADPLLASIPLVLHSSMSNPSNRIKAMEIGADGFIPKFDPDEIARLILERLSGKPGG
ncbi:MAG: chemotaxis protein CheV [Magnetococcales bacterium]|nr:chemotaxis protein CheV [Magnetococcales bacterium]MBF0155812.1 chemotaxis protein CheV [Magnetococcales bacterium]